jgi:hypothetical protein
VQLLLTDARQIRLMREIVAYATKGARSHRSYGANQKGLVIIFAVTLRQRWFGIFFGNSADVLSFAMALSCTTFG